MKVDNSNNKNFLKSQDFSLAFPRRTLHAVLKGRSGCLFTIKMVVIERIMSHKVLIAALNVMVKLVEM